MDTHDIIIDLLDRGYELGLIQLLKKEAFKWIDSATQAFQQLKDGMTLALVLALPKFSQPFKVETDASEHMIGATLSQQ